MSFNTPRNFECYPEESCDSFASNVTDCDDSTLFDASQSCGDESSLCAEAGASASTTNFNLTAPKLGPHSEGQGATSRNVAQGGSIVSMPPGGSFVSSSDTHNKMLQAMQRSVSDIGDMGLHTVTYHTPRKIQVTPSQVLETSPFQELKELLKETEKNQQDGFRETATCAAVQSLNGPTVNGGIHDVSMEIQETKQGGLTEEIPRLEIIEEPEETYRARYESEGCRGPIHGETENSYPTVKVVGYTGDVVMVVFLVTKDGEPHLHSVNGPGSTKCHTEETKVHDDIPGIQMYLGEAQDMTAVWDCLSVRRIRNWEADRLLRMRGIDPATWKNKKKEARLMFQATIPPQPDKANGYILTCQSRSFLCTAPSGSPEIWWTSLLEGSPKGGEEMGIVGKKFSSGFRVRFFCCGEDGTSWEAYGDIDRQKSHQGACVLKTPAYKDADTTNSINVNVEIRVGSDKEPRCSDPVTFTYRVKSTPKSQEEGCLNCSKFRVALQHLFQNNSESSSPSCTPRTRTSSDGSNRDDDGPPEKISLKQNQRLQPMEDDTSPHVETAPVVSLPEKSPEKPITYKVVVPQPPVVPLRSDIAPGSITVPILTQMPVKLAPVTSISSQFSLSSASPVTVSSVSLIRPIVNSSLAISQVHSITHPLQVVSQTPSNLIPHPVCQPGNIRLIQTTCVPATTALPSQAPRFQIVFNPASQAVVIPNNNSFVNVQLAQPGTQVSFTPTASRGVNPGTTVNFASTVTQPKPVSTTNNVPGPERLIKMEVDSSTSGDVLTSSNTPGSQTYLTQLHQLLLNMPEALQSHLRATAGDFSVERTETLATLIKQLKSVVSAQSAVQNSTNGTDLTVKSLAATNPVPTATVLQQAPRAVSQTVSVPQQSQASLLTNSLRFTSNVASVASQGVLLDNQMTSPAYSLALQEELKRIQSLREASVPLSATNLAILQQQQYILEQQRQYIEQQKLKLQQVQQQQAQIQLHQAQNQHEQQQVPLQAQLQARHQAQQQAEQQAQLQAQQHAEQQAHLQAQQHAEQQAQLQAQQQAEQQAQLQAQQQAEQQAQLQAQQQAEQQAQLQAKQQAQLHVQQQAAHFQAQQQAEQQAQLQAQQQAQLQAQQQAQLQAQQQAQLQAQHQAQQAEQKAQLQAQQQAQQQVQLQAQQQAQLQAQQQAQLQAQQQVQLQAQQHAQLQQHTLHHVQQVQVQNVGQFQASPATVWSNVPGSKSGTTAHGQENVGREMQTSPFQGQFQGSHPSTPLTVLGQLSFVENPGSSSLATSVSGRTTTPTNVMVKEEASPFSSGGSCRYVTLSTASSPVVAPDTLHVSSVGSQLPNPGGVSDEVQHIVQGADRNTFPMQTSYSGSHSPSLFLNTTHYTNSSGQGTLPTVTQSTNEPGQQVSGLPSCENTESGHDLGSQSSQASSFVAPPNVALSSFHRDMSQSRALTTSSERSLYVSGESQATVTSSSVTTTAEPTLKIHFGGFSGVEAAPSSQTTAPVYSDASHNCLTLPVTTVPQFAGTATFQQTSETPGIFVKPQTPAMDIVSGTEKQVLWTQSTTFTSQESDYIQASYPSLTPQPMSLTDDSIFESTQFGLQQPSAESFTYASTDNVTAGFEVAKGGKESESTNLQGYGDSASTAFQSSGDTSIPQGNQNSAYGDTFLASDETTSGNLEYSYAQATNPVQSSRKVSGDASGVINFWSKQSEGENLGVMGSTSGGNADGKDDVRVKGHTVHWLVSSENSANGFDPSQFMNQPNTETHQVQDLTDSTTSGGGNQSTASPFGVQQHVNIVRETAALSVESERMASTSSNPVSFPSMQTYDHPASAISTTNHSDFSSMDNTQFKQSEATFEQSLAQDSDGKKEQLSHSETDKYFTHSAYPKDDNVDRMEAGEWRLQTSDAGGQQLFNQETVAIQNEQGRSADKPIDLTTENGDTCYGQIDQQTFSNQFSNAHFATSTNMLSPGFIIDDKHEISGFTDDISHMVQNGLLTPEEVQVILRSARENDSLLLEMYRSAKAELATIDKLSLTLKLWLSKKHHQSPE